MEQWAAVVADSLLLAVTLAGGIWTLLRAQQVSRRATLLAAAACLTLIGWMLYQLVWWLLSVPASHSNAEIAAGAGHSDAGTVLTGVVVSIAVALLFAAVNSGADQPAAAPGGAAPGGAIPGGAAPGAIPGGAARAAAIGRAAPSQANGYGQHPPAGAHSGGAAAAGWTPPQQAHPNDWNIMSGVWSIPRGTFDGPPPDDSTRQ